MRKSIVKQVDGCRKKLDSLVGPNKAGKISALRFKLTEVRETLEACWQAFEPDTDEADVAVGYAFHDAKQTVTHARDLLMAAEQQLNMVRMQLGRLLVVPESADGSG